MLIIKLASKKLRNEKPDFELEIVSKSIALCLLVLPMPLLLFNFISKSVGQKSLIFFVLCIEIRFSDIQTKKRLTTKNYLDRYYVSFENFVWI